MTPAATSIQVTSSINPALPGQDGKLTAIVSVLLPGRGTAIGKVKFKVDGVYFGDPVSLTDGYASISTASLTHGYHTVIAEYRGSINFMGSTNSMASQQSINTPPVAVDDLVERPYNDYIEIAISTLLSNDTDADLDSLSLTAVDSHGSNGGSAVIRGTSVFYFPPNVQTTNDTFHYTISDGQGGTATALVTVSILTNSKINRIQFANGSATLSLSGVPGSTYTIQAATDFANPTWVDIGTVTFPDDRGLTQFTDTNAGLFNSRFYRVLLQE